MRPVPERYAKDESNGGEKTEEESGSGDEYGYVSRFLRRDEERRHFEKVLPWTHFLKGTKKKKLLGMKIRDLMFGFGRIFDVLRKEKVEIWFES